MYKRDNPWPLLEFNEKDEVNLGCPLTLIRLDPLEGCYR